MKTQRRIHVAVAAALAVGGWCFVPATHAADAGDEMQKAGQNAGDAAEHVGRAAKDATNDAADSVRDVTSDANPAMDHATRARLSTAKLPAGAKAVERDDANDIRDLLSTVAQAAVTEDGFKDVVERLADQDRNRIGKTIDNVKIDTLNGRIAQIQKAWKSKYGQDFAVDTRKALMNVGIIQGEVENPQLVMSNWPVSANAPEEKSSNTPRANADEDRVENANLEKGRQLAIATFPAADNMKALNVSVLGETTAWRVDIPNNISAQNLHDNLLAALTYIGENNDKWPSDVNAASEMVTDCVVGSLYGVVPGN